MAHEQPAVRTTIVGGRPPGSGTGIGPIPRGVEVLVKKAAVDPAFRPRLLAARAAAAADLGLELSPSEAALLAAVPAAQLEAMIAGTRVPERQRLAFLGSAAAVMLAAIGLTGCSDDGPKPAGIRPEQAPPPQTQPAPKPDPRVNEGIRPDLPEPREEPAPAPPKPDPIPTSRGVRPDLPLDRDEVRPTKGIRPDVPQPDPPPAKPAE